MNYIKVQGTTYYTLPSSVGVQHGTDQTQMVDVSTGQIALYISRPNNGQSHRYADVTHIELRFDEKGWASPCLYDRLETLHQTNRPFNLELPVFVDVRPYLTTRVSATLYMTPFKDIQPLSGTWEDQVFVDGVVQGSGYTVDENEGTITFSNPVAEHATVTIMLKWVPTVIITASDMRPLNGLYGNRHTYGGTVRLTQLFSSKVNDPDRGEDLCLADVEPETVDVIGGTTGGIIPPTPCANGIIVVGNITPIVVDIPVLTGTDPTQVQDLPISTAWLPDGHVILGVQLVTAKGFNWPENSPLDWSQGLTYEFNYKLTASADVERTFYTKEGFAGGFDLASSFDTVEESLPAFGGGVSPRFSQLHLPVPVVNHKDGLVISLSSTLNPATSGGAGNPSPIRLDVTYTRKSNMTDRSADSIDSRTATGQFYMPSTYSSKVTRVVLSDMLTTSIGVGDPQPKKLVGYESAIKILMTYVGKGDPPSQVKILELNTGITNETTGDPGLVIEKNQALTAPNNFSLADTTDASEAALPSNTVLHFNEVSVEHQYHAKANTAIERPGLATVTNEVTVNTQVEVEVVEGWTEVVVRVFHGQAAATCPINVGVNGADVLASTTYALLAADDPVLSTYEGQPKHELTRITSTGRAGIELSTVTIPADLHNYLVIGVRLVGQVRSTEANTFGVDWSPTGVYGWAVGTEGYSLALAANEWTYFEAGGPLDLLGYEPTGSVFSNTEMFLGAISNNATLRVFSGANLDPGDTLTFRGLRLIYYVAPRT